MLERLRRVTRKNPCPICGKPDWCGHLPDGTLAICMRESDGSVATSRNGGYTHVLKERDIVRPALKPKTRVVTLPVQEIAPIERRHDVFTAFLEPLTLSGRHADDLEARGFSDTEIVRQLYASAPDECRAQEIVDDLSQGFDLSGIAGFYFRDSAWRLVKMDSGFLIPIRDQYGRIQALQLRRDEGEPRYTWVSSRGYPSGVSSGTPMHFSKPWRVETTCKLVITEGALKAQIAAEFLDDCVLGLAGVSTFADTIGIDLRRLFPTLERVSLAYDADWKTNQHVKRSLLRLIDALEVAGLKVSVMNWVREGDSSGPKGIDNLLSEATYAEYYKSTAL